MLTINGLMVHFDVDDTLVMWGRSDASDLDAVKFVCPAGVCYPDAKKGVFSDLDQQAREVGGWTEYLKVHKKHIAQLKEHAIRGHKVVVWSAGGADWAEAVVKALGLERYVTLCMMKPMWAYDDKKPEEYMPKSQWIEYKDQP